MFNFKLALVCAVLVTATAEKCNTACTLFTKFEDVVDGKTEDLLADMPESFKKCDEALATACPDSTVCLSLTPTIKADTTVGESSGKVTITSKSEMCAPSGAEMTDDLCKVFSSSLESVLEGVMINGKKITNLETECGKFSGASGLGFSAILVTIMYILY